MGKDGLYEILTFTVFRSSSEVPAKFASDSGIYVRVAMHRYNIEGQWKYKPS